MQKINRKRVICAQIGARDHYAYPRAYHLGGHLEILVTDYWNRPPICLPQWLAPRMAGRYHPALSNARVWSPNFATLIRRLRHRKSTAWQRVGAMNAGFQKDVLKRLDSISPPGAKPDHITLFSYSYAARDLLIEAKRRGWNTILCQIDPGIEERNLVEALGLAHPDWECNRFAPPQRYFDQWLEECELADKIIVNSEWSKQALIRQGIHDAKIVEIPILYTPLQATAPRRQVSGSFSATRPLRLLFLGQVSLRKGIRELVLAMHRLRDEPVELTVVGVPQVSVPENLKSLGSITWIGGVPRSETSMFFSQADAFILPTHSDGFGLTQLEALAHGVPVIASTHCARVVTDHVNGRILGEVTEEAIEIVIREILAAPTSLAAWTSRCEIPAACQPENVAGALNGLL